MRNDAGGWCGHVVRFPLLCVCAGGDSVERWAVGGVVLCVSFRSGMRADACQPSEARRRVIAASHKVLDCDEKLLFHKRRGGVCECRDRRDVVRQ